MKQGYVYILTNKHRTTFYTGVTSDIKKRIFEHHTGRFEGFAKKYNLCDLVYLEEFLEIGEAIFREKQLKSYSRKKKLDLICKQNPEILDLKNGL